MQKKKNTNKEENVLTCVLNHFENYSSCNWKIYDSVGYEF